jgi:hypothetical protein
VKKQQPRVRKSQRRVRPDFVRRAERAMKRVARKLRAEHRRTGTPLVVWDD